MNPTTSILTLRFPDGDVEHRFTRGELPIGALVRSRGNLWRISQYVGPVAFLEAAEEPVDGAPGGPLVLPSPFGDTPLTLEVLAEA